MKIERMKSVRIGAGLGFYGDNWEPVAASIERGGVQFIASDHLAELTLAILQKDRQRDPALGYARDVVPMLLKLWPLMRERGVRFVCNAGGLNPRGAAQAVLAAFQAKGWQAKVAVVTGDDVLPRLQSAEAGFDHLFTHAEPGRRARAAGVCQRLRGRQAHRGRAGRGRRHRDHRSRGRRGALPRPAGARSGLDARRTPPPNKT